MEVFMEGPANTLSYMLLGYGVIFGIMLIYLVSLAVRTRNLKQDEALLQELDKENSQE
ncbi:hypothetical protein ANT_19380 [Anaerolinea thermophila UNI-1]|uniref:CcmD family protein n=2 Tax=Anaerolinea thermophila TaxID=167964 RepID=E8N6A0_ANATU|nr:hypothetical protein ANT_19380 [Anaerolinea thermophila UNI-1]